MVAVHSVVATVAMIIAQESGSRSAKIGEPLPKLGYDKDDGEE